MLECLPGGKARRTRMEGDSEPWRVVDLQKILQYHDILWFYMIVMSISSTLGLWNSKNPLVGASALRLSFSMATPCVTIGLMGMIIDAVTKTSREIVPKTHQKPGPQLLFMNLFGDQGRLPPLIKKYCAFTALRSCSSKSRSSSKRISSSGPKLSTCGTKSLEKPGDT